MSYFYSYTQFQNNQLLAWTVLYIIKASKGRPKAQLWNSITYKHKKEVTMKNYVEHFLVEIGLE